MEISQVVTHGVQYDLQVVVCKYGIKKGDRYEEFTYFENLTEMKGNPLRLQGWVKECKMHALLAFNAETASWKNTQERIQVEPAAEKVQAEFKSPIPARVLTGKELADTLKEVDEVKADLEAELLFNCELKKASEQGFKENQTALKDLIDARYGDSESYKAALGTTATAKIRKALDSLVIGSEEAEAAFNQICDQIESERAAKEAKKRDVLYFMRPQPSQELQSVQSTFVSAAVAQVLKEAGYASLKEAGYSPADVMASLSGINELPIGYKESAGQYSPAKELSDAIREFMTSSVSVDEYA